MALACDSLGNNAVIGANSCNGLSACRSAGLAGSVSIGDGSCNGVEACASAGQSQSSSGTIGNSSCNGFQACRNAGHFGNSSIGDGSCNGSSACASAGSEGTSTIGDSSCIGDLACPGAGFRGSSSIGHRSCNRNPNSRCPGVGLFLSPAIGDCELNQVAVAGCPDNIKPTVTATFIDVSTGQPYLPGTPTRGPVKVLFTCADEPGGSGIPGGAGHNDSTPSGAGSRYPALIEVTRTQSLGLDPRWKCMDAASNLADPPAGFPLNVVIDRIAPRCSVVLSLMRIKRDGTPTPVTATVTATDTGGAGVAPGDLKIVSISPAPVAGGPALPDVSPGTWTLKGAIGKVFTFTGQATDRAGNAATCTARVASSIR